MNSQLKVSVERSKTPVHGPPPAKKAPPQKQDGPEKEGHVVIVQIVDQDTRKPISGAKYEVLDPAGKKVAQGSTDWQGGGKHDVPKAGTYTVNVLEVPDEKKAEAPKAPPRNRKT
jgi:hypothetical protein